MRHECHRSDRHILSGSGAARSLVFADLCETAISLTQLRETLSLIDRRRSDAGTGVCTPFEKPYGRGRWLWRPQTHPYLERKRRQVGIFP